jgi:hypothetical protein
MCYFKYKEIFDLKLVYLNKDLKSFCEFAKNNFLFELLDCIRRSSSCFWLCYDQVELFSRTIFRTFVMTRRVGLFWFEFFISFSQLSFSFQNNRVLHFGYCFTNKISPITFILVSVTLKLLINHSRLGDVGIFPTETGKHWINKSPRNT